jgi:hypothetical protein
MFAQARQLGTSARRIPASRPWGLACDLFEIRRLLRFSVSVALAMGLTALPAAQAATFYVDPAQSTISVSGTIGGNAFTPQGPNSLSTTYRQTLNLQLASDSVTFPGGSVVIGNNSGTWQPAIGGGPGSGPANYGGQLTLFLFFTHYGAMRNMVFDITSGQLALSGGQFSPAVSFIATGGNFDYDGAFSGAGSAPLAGNSGANATSSSGSFSVTPGFAGGAVGTVHIPVSFTFNSTVGTLGNGIFNFNGSIGADNHTIAGDANFDSSVDTLDFNVLAASFSKTGRKWYQGDFTFDGSVDTVDFNILAAHFGQTAAPPLIGANVPEPAGLLILLLVAPIGCRPPLRKEVGCARHTSYHQPRTSSADLARN